MHLKKLRASDIPLLKREKRVLRNLLHSSCASLLYRVSQPLSRMILRNALGKQKIEPFALPVAYAQVALQDHLHCHIAPMRLTYRLHDWVSADHRPYHVNDFFLCSADWSQALNPIDKSPVYLEAMQLQAVGLDYRSTAGYEKYIRQLEKGSAPTRNKSVLDTKEKIDLYFERFVSLFRSIQVHGLVSLEEARRMRDSLNSRSAIRSWRTNFGESNLGIAFGPDGEIVALPGGQHRLAIAIALKLDKIPAELRLLHTQCLPEKRNSSAAAIVENIKASM